MLERITERLKRIYFWVMKLVLRALIEWCHERGRVVHYVHKLPDKTLTFQIEGEPVTLPQGRIYLTRYCLWGHMSGESRGDELKRWQVIRDFNEWGVWGKVRYLGWGNCFRALLQWVRSHLPNVYLHCIQYPDIDPSVHNHPWPWGFAVGLMGAYTEERLTGIASDYESPGGAVHVPITYKRHFRAPFFNWISGKAFHRIADLTSVHALNVPYRRVGIAEGPVGVWTLFVAGPRAHSKPWGYLAADRGFVPQEERHAEIGASELVEPGHAKGEYLDALGSMYGVKRRTLLWGLLVERDKHYRKRIAAVWCAHDEREAQADSGDRITLESVPVDANGEPS